MADEAIIVELLGDQGDVVRYTCADNTGIPKGTLLEMTTPRTVVSSSQVDVTFAGIAASEKVANDGQTSIGVYTNGIFQLTVKNGGTPATIGDHVSLSSVANRVELSSSLDKEKGWSVGVAMEAIASDAIGMVRIHK